LAKLAVEKQLSLIRWPTTFMKLTSQTTIDYNTSTRVLT